MATQSNQKEEKTYHFIAIRITRYMKNIEQYIIVQSEEKTCYDLLQRRRIGIASEGLLSEWLNRR